MGNTFFFEWEVIFEEWLQSVIGNFGASLASIFTFLGEQVLLAFIVAYFYWCKDKNSGKYIAENLMFVTVLSSVIKNIFIRRRPYFDNDGIKCLRAVDKGADIYDISAQGYSFPSSHSSTSVALYASLAKKIKSKTAIITAVLFPILIGISRVALGVHYPTDVICGWLLGILTLVALDALRDIVKNDVLRYAILTTAGTFGFFFCKSTDYYSSYGLMTGMFFGFVFEERFVGFTASKNLLTSVFRVIFGLGIFVSINFILKLPFDKAFLDSATMGAYSVRCVRYAAVGFIGTGLYPMLFDKIALLKTKER